MFRTLLLLALLLPLPAVAQTLDGDWHGTLDAGPAHLRLVFHFQTERGVLNATLFSIDQGGAAVPAGSVTLKQDDLTIDLPAIPGSYHGTITGDTITGTWTHAPRSWPLVLSRGSLSGVALHVPEPGDLTIATPSGILGGTILTAGNGKLAAVLIGGSGNADRDGNSAANGGRDTYRQIAKGLAAHGITTLRFDKRGIGASAKAAGPESGLRVQMYGDDVKAWAAELKRRTGASCVWLIGHSEGVLIAELAATGNKDVCGIVSLAGAGRKLAAILREQLDRNLPEAKKATAFAVLDSLTRGEMMPDPPAELMGLFRPSIQSYVMSELALDPAAILHELKIPVLILQGDADVQVSVTDAQTLAKARPDAVLKILPGVNHSQRIAKDDPGTGPGPLAAGEMDMIANFMHEHSP